MIPRGPAVSRLSASCTEKAVRPPAGLGNMDGWEKCDLGQKMSETLSTLQNICTVYIQYEILCHTKQLFDV